MKKWALSFIFPAASLRVLLPPLLTITPQYIPMKPAKPLLAHTINYYAPLLERYAIRLINDTEVVAKLVQQVLEDQFEIDGLAPSENLRRVLKTDLLNRCHYINQSITFDPSPPDLHMDKYPHTPFNHPKNRNQ